MINEKSDKMKRRIINKVYGRMMMVAVCVLPLSAVVSVSAQTLEECQQAAEHNYPLIRQYDLIARTTELTVDNVRKGWLPQLTATAQATWQSSVTAWPDEMQAMMGQMGIDVRGLKKDQYRVGIDVNQVVYDGGSIRSRQEVARRQGHVGQLQNEVSLYAVRQRVNEMYFGLLLLDDQLRLNEEQQELLLSSERKLASMYRNGTAAESDYKSVKAERLNVVQQHTSLQAQRQTLQRMLALFCGWQQVEPVKPQPVAGSVSTAEVLRPELRLIDAQLQLADAQEKALDASLMPRLSVFASGFYGYPGYNLFEDMLNHRWTLNGMIGARLTWNIGALYTRHNDRRQLNTQRETWHVQRAVFLLNNRLESMQQDEAIVRYRRMMADDEEIISLRSAVRKAAESRLSHGIIDVNGLVKEINSESAARLQQSMHEIEMLKQMYDLRYTVNR